MARDVYELWSVESGSVLMAYPTEGEALALVRANFEQFGREAVQGLIVIRDRRGHSTVLWEGDELVRQLDCKIPQEETPRKVDGGSPSGAVAPRGPLLEPPVHVVSSHGAGPRQVRMMRGGLPQPEC